MKPLLAFLIIGAQSFKTDAYLDAILNGSNLSNETYENSNDSDFYDSYYDNNDTNDYYDAYDYTGNDYDLNKSYDAVSWALQRVTWKADEYFSHLKNELRKKLKAGNFTVTQLGWISPEDQMKPLQDRLYDLGEVYESYKLDLFICTGLVVVLVVSFSIAMCCVIKKSKNDDGRKKCCKKCCKEDEEKCLSKDAIDSDEKCNLNDEKWANIS